MLYTEVGAQCDKLAVDRQSASTFFEVKLKTRCDDRPVVKFRRKVLLFLGVSLADLGFLEGVTLGTRASEASEH